MIQMGPIILVSAWSKSKTRVVPGRVLVHSPTEKPPYGPSLPLDQTGLGKGQNRMYMKAGEGNVLIIACHIWSYFCVVRSYQVIFLFSFIPVHICFCFCPICLRFGSQNDPSGCNNFSVGSVQVQNKSCAGSSLGAQSNRETPTWTVPPAGPVWPRPRPA